MITEFLTKKMQILLQGFSAANLLFGKSTVFWAFAVALRCYKAIHDH